MTVGSPPSRTVTTELVVPRSIPTARAMGDGLSSVCWAGGAGSWKPIRTVLARRPLNFPAHDNGSPRTGVPGVRRISAAAPRHHPSPRTPPTPECRGMADSAAVQRGPLHLAAAPTGPIAVVHRPVPRIGRLAAHFRGASAPAV